MKQVLQPASGVAVVRDVPAPRCEPNGLLVRNHYSVISSGTERTRVELSQKSLLGKAKERPDLLREVIDRARRDGVKRTASLVRTRLGEEVAVGYSSSGVVLEVGPQARGFAVGDRVACAGAGHANHAEIVAIPANLAVKVPPGASLRAAAMGTIGAIAMHGVRLCEVSLGERVGVIGCGLIGQITIRLLKAAGTQVHAIDIDPERIAEGQGSGADFCYLVASETAVEVRERSAGIGLDAVLVTAAAASSDPLLLAVQIARERGAVVLVGAVPIEFPRGPLFDKELRFRVSRSYGPGRYDSAYEERGLDYPIGYVRWTEQRNIESVLALVAGGGLRLEDLVDSIVPVEQAADAYRRLAGEGAAPRGAIVLSYGPNGNGAAAADPTQLPSPAAPTAPPAPAGAAVRPTRLRPGAPPRIGLVGPGHFASAVLVPALLGAGARLELVGGGSGPSAEAAQRRLGFARVAPSAEAVLEDPALDAVVIATRHDAHARLAQRALQAGKHVFCEKPLALSAEELEPVIEAARRSRGLLAVGFNRRFSELLIAASDFLGDAGRAILTYRVSAGRLDRSHWIHDLERGGGRAIGEGCHFLDCLVFVTGSEIRRVHAVGFGDPEMPLQSADNLGITAELADGSLGTLQYLAIGSPKLPKERLEAFRGSRTVVLDDYRRLELLGPSGTDVRRLRVQDKGHGSELKAFVAAMRSGEPPVALGQIRNVSLASYAVSESLSRGMPVEVG